ncbi:mechanosensitive ion channel domain-containing protein [uncultured Litoreibacter sp.]|uniref:mechanosensitive ion channel family protein n=1 Tax=uncultured Litoreibacter sp. TaxID=1392394 RepID=UPI002617F518|nr:mechanosensitive ion channel domain-containing protein [uncultured Litoreibacter sp.]
MDTDTLPPFVAQALDYLAQGWDIAQGWLLSPAAWSQFAILVVAYGLAVVVSRMAVPRIAKVLTPPADNQSALATARRFVLQFLPLLLPLIAFALTGVGEQATRSIFGSGEVIAFGKRVFIFIAARIFVRDILKVPFLKLLGKYILIPVAALYAVGLLDNATLFLEDTRVQIGNIGFSLMAIVRGVIAGSILFWLGGWSNQQSADYIEQQEIRPSLRTLLIKAVEFLIFGAAFLLLMNIMGINLSALAVLGGAIGVGLGFGLQKIASNFISGVILLLEGQATVGDYVELDGGEQGKIVKMMARAAILETFDGRWVVVPNEDFITTRVINYSDSGSANRFEAPFSVTYETDINRVPDIVERAVATHKDVLSEPFPPDCELRGFGESGVDFACEFWVNGLDDGEHKYTSDILFLIWNALKDEGIEMPYPRRVIEIKGGMPGQD